MPKLWHLKLEGYAYFITTCLENRRRLCRNPRLARIVMDAVLYGRASGWYLLLAFVVMPDHLHLVVVPRAKTVPAAMRELKTFTAKRVGQRLGSEGKIWQKGYRDFVLDRKASILQKIRYIEANPVRAGLVESAEDYEFSSAGRPELVDWEFYAVP